MFQAFFNGLSGLFSFSQGLNTVSNNVSNMNTPGFRGSDNVFQGVASSGQGGGGFGTQIADVTLRTTQGEIRQTGTSTDMAINGSGLFLLRADDGTVYYTRAGQFRIDDQGFLVDSATGHHVAGIDAAGNLFDINIASLRTLPPQPTTQVVLTGNLAPTSSSHSISSVQVYDALGNTHALSVAFTNTSAVTPNSWSVTVTDSAGTTVGTGEIRFAIDGSPLSGFNSITVTLTGPGTAQTIALDFGTPGGYAGATLLAGATSSLGARVVDGRSVIGLTTVGVNDAGILQLQYSNGDTNQGPQIALAHFADESVLRPSTGSLFSANDLTGRTLGRANASLFGRVVGGSLELSNVELTQEFADLIILQRGYQASSRVLTVANEMVEQLYGNGGGR